ncbi:MAG: ABC transporter ATP-binding protein [Halalkalicoccus sp.]|nr:ABC transporter ATP-binding protein [Halalkalicoccus sp.]
MVDVHLQEVSKRYADGEGPLALEDVSLDIADGEFFTLVGPSGCGKTTTLRLLAGFEGPSSGAVRFDERDIEGVPPERRDVGVVVQDYALFPHMNVAENVGYGLRFRDPPGGSIEGRIEELLALVDLEGAGGRSPGTLSGGQRQRVALARALAPDPQLLLLDEPLSALDARLRKTLRRQIRRIQSELGVTTVYVTHDQEEALAVSDRVAVMNEGRIEQVGTPETVYRRPTTRFVARFVGENTLLDGRVLEARTDPESGTHHLCVDCHGQTLAVRTDRAVSGSVTVCVRPTAFSSTVTDNRIRVRVEHAEFLGGVVRVHARWNGTPIVVTTDGVPDGDALEVGFRPSDAWVLEE